MKLKWLDDAKALAKQERLCRLRTGRKTHILADVFDPMPRTLCGRDADESEEAAVPDFIWERCDSCFWIFAIPAANKE